MKLITKSGNYIPPNNKGIYPNAYLEDGEKAVNREISLDFTFNLFYELNGEIVKSDLKTHLRLNETHIPTYVYTGEIPITSQEATAEIAEEIELENPNFERFEILEYVSSGGDINKVVGIDFGRPSVRNGKPYFVIESIPNELELAESPLKEVVKQWMLNILTLNGEPLSNQFKFEDDK